MAEANIRQCQDYIAPEDLKVFRNGSNNLCVRIEGRGEWEKVTVRLAFPYSDPGHFIVLSHEEREIGVIRDLHQAEENSRALLKEMMAKRYHVPEITIIVSIEEVRNAMRWTVETDKGCRSFDVRDRYNFRRIRGGAIIIVDVEANRFRISDPSALGEESQKLLDIYL